MVQSKHTRLHPWNLRNLMWLMLFLPPPPTASAASDSSAKLINECHYHRSLFTDCTSRPRNLNLKWNLRENDVTKNSSKEEKHTRPRKNNSCHFSTVWAGRFFFIFIAKFVLPVRPHTVARCIACPSLWCTASRASTRDAIWHNDTTTLRE